MAIITISRGTYAGAIIIDGTANSLKTLELIPQVAKSVEGVREGI